MELIFLDSNGGKMKALIFVILATSLSVFAENVDLASFVFNGSETTHQLALKGEKTHTEHQYEDIVSTCYETVVTGTHEVCEQFAHEICGSFQLAQRPKPPGEPPTPSNNTPSEPPDRPERPDRPNPDRPLPTGEPPIPSHNPPSRPLTCHTVYKEVCRHVNDTEDRPYSCIQTIDHPYSVKDYDILANVIFNIGKVPAGVVAQEAFTVSLKEGNVQVSVADNENQSFVEPVLPYIVCTVIRHSDL